MVKIITTDEVKGQGGRFTLKEALQKIAPITKLIAPFGVQNEIREYLDKNAKIITKDTSSKEHRKIAIGKKGAIFDSWNFTEGARLYSHELIAICNKDSKEYITLNDIFDKVYFRI